MFYYALPKTDRSIGEALERVNELKKLAQNKSSNNTENNTHVFPSYSMAMAL